MIKESTGRNWLSKISKRFVAEVILLFGDFCERGGLLHKIIFRNEKEQYGSYCTEAI